MAFGLLGRLWYDLLDAALSWLDTFFGGALGLDWGDWIAALLNFNRQRRISGFGWACLYAWEAANFFPASIVPGVGEVIEVFTNLTPLNALLTPFTEKYSKVQKENDRLEELITAAARANITVKDAQEQRLLIEKAVSDDNPAKAYGLAAKAIRTLRPKVRAHCDAVLTDATALVRDAAQNADDRAEAELDEAGALLAQATAAHNKHAYAEAEELAQRAVAVAKAAMDGETVEEDAT